MSITINEGTQSVINTASVGGTETQVVRLDIGAGTVAGAFTGSIANIAKVHNAGTIAVLPDLPGGTVDAVTNVAFGTVDTFYRHPDAFATTVSTGTNVLGTIKPAVSGSIIYVTDLVISAGTATNVLIASGGTSTPILGTLHFADNGGAVMNFVTPLRTVSGSALVYKQSTATSPLSITAQGYVD